MTIDELKKKIVEIFSPYVAERWHEHITDAIIAAGLTFDKTTAILAERTNSKTLIHKAQYYDEMKLRAEVAERALNNCVEYYSYSALCPVLDCNYNKACWRKECTLDIVECFKIQAEKELAEEREDE